jgi:hypothetical protein
LESTPQCSLPIEGSPLPAIPGVKRLRGALPDEGYAARAEFFPIGSPVHPTHVNGEEFETIPAVAEFILLIHRTAASGTHKRTPSLRVINIESVTAYPALEYLDVTVTVVDHVTETTFVAYHSHLASVKL